MSTQLILFLLLGSWCNRLVAAIECYVCNQTPNNSDCESSDLSKLKPYLVECNSLNLIPSCSRATLRRRLMEMKNVEPDDDFGDYRKQRGTGEDVAIRRGSALLLSARSPRQSNATVPSGAAGNQSATSGTTCKPPEQRNYVVCRKVEQGIDMIMHGMGPVERTVRMCGYKKSGVEEMKRTSYSTRHWEYECSESRCNAAEKSVRPNFWFIVIVLTCLLVVVGL